MCPGLPWRSKGSLQTFIPPGWILSWSMPASLRTLENKFVRIFYLNLKELVTLIRNKEEGWESLTFDMKQEYYFLSKMWSYSRNFYPFIMTEFVCQVDRKKRNQFFFIKTFSRCLATRWDCASAQLWSDK